MDDPKAELKWGGLPAVGERRCPPGNNDVGKNLLILAFCGNVKW
jgi:hypothetical protein